MLVTQLFFFKSLKVNGRDVSTKEDTESLFAENKNAVTLLVSRCLFTVSFYS